MACCGGKRQQLATAGPTQTSPGPTGQTPFRSPGGDLARRSAVCFEYAGRTGMTVVGPVTGIRYRFDYPGARVFVDLRDRASLAAVPNLRQIRDP